MTKVSYRKIAGPDGYLARCEAFEGNTLSARWQHDKDGNDSFVVYSYSTPIAAYVPSKSQVWFSPFRYSVTTSKHQGYTRAWLAHYEDKVQIP